MQPSKKQYLKLTLTTCILFSTFLTSFAQFSFAKEKVIYGSKKKGGKIGILYTLNDGTYLFQYGELGEKGFVHGKGISVFFKWEPSSSSLSDAKYGIDSWKYDDEYYEGDIQNGIKFGKGKLKDRKQYYEGDFENNLPHGFGEIKKHDGRTTNKFVYKYKGFFYKGFPHGPGELMEHGNLGVSVAHYPNEYFIGMIINGNAKGLTLYQKEGGIDNLNRKKTSEFVYRAGNYIDVKSLSDLINGDTSSFINLFDYSNTLYLNKDTLYNGQIDENKKLNGLGYLISSNGSVLCGIFKNGKLNGYGFTYTVKDKIENSNNTEYTIYDYVFMNGLFLDNKLIKGSKTYNKLQVRNTATSFLSYGGNLTDILDLELKTKELENIYYSGTFNDAGKLEGSNCYYDSHSETKQGSFKNGLLHGIGKLKNKVGEYDGRFEEGKFKEGTISYAATGPMGPPHNAFILVNGEIGVFNSYTGKTHDGRYCGTDWSYYPGSTKEFISYCKVCKGSGNVWKKSTSTYQQYTHLENKSSTVTYGSRTFVKTWSEPQYKSVSVTKEYSTQCDACQGKGSEIKSLEEIKAIINSRK